MKRTPSGNVNSKNIAPASKNAGVIKVKETTKANARKILINEFYKSIEISISQIKKANEIITSKDSPEETIIRLDELFKDIYLASSPEAVRKFQKLIGKEMKRSKHKDFSHEYCGIEKNTIHDIDENDEVTKLIAFHNGITRIKGKIAEIGLFKKYPELLDSENPDSIYEGNIRGTQYEETFLSTFGTIDEIIKVNLELDEYRNIDFENMEDYDEANMIEPPKIPNDFTKKQTYRQLAYGFSESKSLRPEFDKISITAFLDDGKYSALVRDRSSGSHYPGTVINLIRVTQNHAQIQVAIEHEKIHNGYNAFVPDQTIKGTQYFNSLFERVSRLMLLQAPEFVIQENFKLLKKKILAFFLSSQGEIIANFHDLKNGKLATALFQYYDIIKELRKKKEDFESKKKLSSENSEILKHLEETIDGLSDYFSIFYRRLADLVFIAEQEGIEKDLFASLILWTPLKYNKIEKYFRMKIGDTRYDYYCTMRTILKPDFFITPKRKLVTPQEKLLSTIFGESPTHSTEKEFRIARHEDYLSTKKLKKFNMSENLPAFESESDEIYEKIMSMELSEIFARQKTGSSLSYMRYERRLLKFLKRQGLSEKQMKTIEGFIFDEYDYYISKPDKRIELTRDMLDNLPEKYDGLLEKSVSDSEYCHRGNKEKISTELMELLKTHPRSKKWLKKA